MPMPPRPPKRPGKKPEVDISLLMAEPEEEASAGDEMGSEDEFGGMDDDLEGGGFEEDPLAAEGDEFSSESSIDPEQAALCEQLGFTEPDQQQALLDLIKLVTGPGAPPPPSMDSGTDTLESGY